MFLWRALNPVRSALAAAKVAGKDGAAPRPHRASAPHPNSTAKAGRSEEKAKETPCTSASATD